MQLISESRKAYEHFKKFTGIWYYLTQKQKNGLHAVNIA
jgi:hypothetical protein